MTVASDLDTRVLAAVGEAVPRRGGKRVEIDAETRLHADLGLDSLGLLALLFNLQESLGAELAEDQDVDLGALLTVGDLLEVARELLAPSLGDQADVAT